jgi:SAM-dependent methyltransferase
LFNNLNDYPFQSSDFLFYFKTLWKDRGPKAIYQFLNRPHRRSFSRSLIKRFAPKDIGLEIGVGARTIAPTERTVLSDAYSEHGVHDSIAQVFFKGDKIPYSDGTFSFVMSEHVLEHIANPISALNEWIRVLRPGGKIILFLPHKERTNDSLREITSLEHLIQDEASKVPYNDDGHFQDWWENVVEKGLMPPHYQHMPKKELLDTCSIHHHVWTDKEIIKLFEYLKLKIVFSNSDVHDRRDSFVVIGEKT